MRKDTYVMFLLGHFSKESILRGPRDIGLALLLAILFWGLFCRVSMKQHGG